MRYFTLLVPALMLVANTACRQAHAEDHDHGYTLVADTLYIDPAGVMRSVIRTEASRTALVSRPVETAGTVQPIPTQYAYIAPPFSGRIVRSYISHGQSVRVNSPLFEIISPDFTAVQKEYLQAQSDTEYARLDLRRKEDLLRNGVGSQKDYEEALNTLHIAEKELENATAALRIYNADPDNVVLGEPLVIRSPLSGSVIENNIVTGLYLGEDAEPVAVVADLRKVWISAQVKEKDIRHISEGDSITVRVTAFPDEVLYGTVFHIDEAVDEETRSIRVLSVCDNSSEKLKLGMYATITFLPSPEPYTVLPQKAVLQGPEKEYIFIKTGPDSYRKTDIEVDFTDGGLAYIRRWEHGQADVISEGGYFIN